MLRRVMSNYRSRILFWFAFSAFAVAAIGAGYYHYFGTGYFRPVLATERRMLELGVVPSDSLTEVEFFVTNAGVRPLRIVSVRTGCAGCVEIISYPTEPIRRGASVPVRVALDTKSLKGNVRKSFLIMSNDPIQQVYPMQINAVVESVNHHVQDI